MTLQTNDGKLIIISGSSRCGKTVKSTRLVRGFDAVFVWDIEAQWCKQKGYQKISDMAQLRKIVQNGKKGKYAYVSQGNIRADFELFCMCVMYFGSFYGACAVVAEELADVTSISKAAEHWGMLCRRGLKRGISIFAISQRWAEADKTAFGNATDFYLFRQSTIKDAKYMSERTGVDLERIKNLAPLEYLHYNPFTKAVEGSKVTF
ncbi:MAG: hypothetical protein V4605_08835 [Pseudomonadota bacterium]